MVGSGTAQLAGREISRRDLVRYGACAGALATVTPAIPGLASPARADGARRARPAPEPIPGGIQIPDGPLLHVFPPGPSNVTLPHSGLTLQGLDVEPNVITDYQGFTAVAYHAGTATGSDGERYFLETDMRAMKGTYVAADGTRRRGVFGFI